MGKTDTMEGECTGKGTGVFQNGEDLLRVRDLIMGSSVGKEEEPGGSL